jgi:hypothetical protein
MGNRQQRPLLFVENCMADVAEAETALQALWSRVYTMCYRPALTLEDVEDLGRELRRVEQGLAAVKRVLQAERAAIGDSADEE